MASTSTDDADDWDTEGFVVPSILTGNSGAVAGAAANPPISTSAGSTITNSEANEIEEKDHLEPGCPASSCYAKQLEPSVSTSADTQTSTSVNTSRKQKLKHKLREADKKFGGQVSGREDKIKSLTEIMGGGTQAIDSGRKNKIKSLRGIMDDGTQENDSDASLKGSSRDWLDPHCRESEFDRQPH
ncbi:Na(+)-translocating NADH-quinone reductase subunit A [Rhynchospora pubera]|uniref:Na(+)-translocating NADH-quinone reductase subunit A n=1 Tax=Rhynchospora pubera TaxID=906938 RepID=A0AAV8GN98_9POAL|nr:Na(+)-translocating NADH-quinone reductase subunit A [Rhynchospora pubera]